MECGIYLQRLYDEEIYPLTQISMYMVAEGAN